jgi:hypothetical protein
MTYLDVPKGLYRITRETRKFGGLVWHHAILDNGNRLRHPDAPNGAPVIYHMTTRGIRAEIMGPETWSVNIGAPIQDLEGAKLRIQLTQYNPDYDLLSNNCEHFVNFVATGKKESKQVQVAGLFVAIGALVAVAFNSKEED